MAETILLLRLEHNQFDVLLKLIEQQLDPDVPVDVELLQCIVKYFTGYPDQCHHPIEDLVFRKLQKRDSKRAARVSEILQDHKNISDMTKRFADTLKEAIVNENIRTTKLRDIMRRFVDQYRKHMAAEEKEFFQLALDLLSENDWAELDYSVFDQKDPLFNRNVEKQFRRLRSKIKELGVTSYRRGIVMREARVLRQLTSIREFNEMMEKARHDYRLVEHPEGAYGLENRGKEVIDIPKCSPARAVWCAYFFVEASTGHNMSA